MEEFTKIIEIVQNLNDQLQKEFCLKLDHLGKEQEIRNDLIYEKIETIAKKIDHISSKFEKLETKLDKSLEESKKTDIKLAALETKLETQNSSGKEWKGYLFTSIALLIALIGLFLKLT